MMLRNMLVTVWIGVFCLSGGECLDQAVRDIKRVVENLEDIKNLLQDLTDVEREVLERLGTMKEIGIEKELEKKRETVINDDMAKKDELTGEPGNLLTMKCRGRVDLSWKVLRAGGDILNLDSQARKLRITLSEATRGVYHCYSAGRLVHSFTVRMTGGNGK